MANFYRDNDDIQFLLRHIEVGKLTEMGEENFKFAEEFDHAPANVVEAMQNGQKMSTAREIPLTKTAP
ncbi:MAG: hypothetical protein ACYSW3_09570 [Planctomycetota bacterium]|jgi:hypothetical protein